MFGSMSETDDIPPLGNDAPYDGTWMCRAKFRCLENDDDQDLIWLKADPVAESAGTVKFRSERCPQCGSNHWQIKEHQRKYE